MAFLKISGFSLLEKSLAARKALLTGIPDAQVSVEDSSIHNQSRIVRTEPVIFLSKVVK